MGRDWTEQVRAVLATARPVEGLNSAAFGCRESPRFHAGGPSRAVARQEIRRIARWYGWQAEVDAVLASASAASLAGLDDETLARLHARMQQLEACVQAGADSPDAPPAR